MHNDGHKVGTVQTFVVLRCRREAEGCYCYELYSAEYGSYMYHDFGKRMRELKVLNGDIVDVAIDSNGRAIGPIMKSVAKSDGVLIRLKRVTLGDGTYV